MVFAAGALGTQRLLHGMKADGVLPGLSPRLGELTRTNSEAILGASVPRQQARSERLDFTEGVAITSSFHPDPQTHIEPVRYGRGSNAMGLLQSLLVDGGPHRVRRWLGSIVRQPRLAARMLSVRGWSERTVIALVMQSRGQLTDHPVAAWPARPQAGHRPGPRHAQPDLDPGRQHRRPAARRRDRRHPRRLAHRAVRHPGDRAHPGRGASSAPPRPTG